MRFSFVIPFWGSDPHRHRALSWHLARLAFFFEDTDLQLSGGRETKASACNAGVEAAKEDVIVLLDADTPFDPRDLREALELLEGGDPRTWVIPYDQHYRFGPEVTDELLNLDPDIELRPHRRRAESASRGSIGGINIFTKDQYVGWDERFTGWGGADNSFVSAMEEENGPPLRTAGRSYHLWHPFDKAAKRASREANLRATQAS